MAKRMEIPDMKTEFSKMVDNDIIRCEQFLSGDHDKDQGMDLHLEMITKYPAYISGFGTSLYNYNAESGFNAEYFSFDAMISNLKVIKNKLSAFKANGYRNSKSVVNDNHINIANNLNATQSQTVTISFEDVKRNIENMTALSDKETEETLKKVDEIKDIVENDQNKKTKWQKIKPILLWLADKSVDVGMSLLPLLLKIES